MTESKTSNQGSNQRPKPDSMTGHEYDGIEELDNPLPRWWRLTFYGTVIFAVIYFGYYQLGSGPSPASEFEEALKEYQVQFKTAQAREDGLDKLRAVLMNTQSHSAGKTIFDAKCAMCHGPAAQGLIGPNLTDDYWLNGDGEGPAILKVVRDGVPAKGMPPWGPVLSDEELLQVTSFIYSVRGSTPANPKASQGELKTRRSL
jgi:cytochrome c oxidase cbb3-type subunit III